MQRRDGNRRFKLVQNIINRAVVLESWSTVHGPMPKRDRSGHFGVG